MRLELIEPSAHRDDRFGTEVKHADPSIVGASLIGNDVCIEQNPEVLAHRRRRDADLGCEVARATGALAEQLDSVQASWVGQCS
jgi:hypothetical protein